MTEAKHTRYRRPIIGAGAIGFFLLSAFGPEVVPSELHPALVVVAILLISGALFRWVHQICDFVLAKGLPMLLVVVGVVLAAAGVYAAWRGVEAMIEVRPRSVSSAAASVTPQPATPAVSDSTKPVNAPRPATEVVPKAAEALGSPNEDKPRTAALLPALKTAEAEAAATDRPPAPSRELVRRRAAVADLIEFITDDLGQVAFDANEMNNRDIFLLTTQGAKPFIDKLLRVQSSDKAARAKLARILEKYRFADLDEVIGTPPSMEMPINRLQDFLESMFRGQPIDDVQSRVFNQTDRHNFTHAIELLKSWNAQALQKLEAKKAEYGKVPAV